MRAVILTKSYKKDRFDNSGWCVVAFDLEHRKLVRFVDEGGAAIPRNALNGKSINVMDIVTVTTVSECPHGPQTENILVRPSTFTRIGTFTPGIGKIMQMIPAMPANEPRFMDDCRYKYMDVSRFHHSIEFVRAYNICSCLYQYGNGEPKRYSQFYTDAGHNSDIRITVPGFYNCDEDWETEDAIAIVTIPMDPWVINGNSVGYFKFVAALYKIPPTQEEEARFVELIRREPLAHPHYVQDALAIPHNKNAEVYVAQIDEEEKSNKDFYNNLLWKTKKPKEEKQKLLLERNRIYNKHISTLRKAIEEVVCTEIM